MDLLTVEGNWRAALHISYSGASKNERGFVFKSFT